MRFCGKDMSRRREVVDGGQLPIFRRIGYRVLGVVMMGSLRVLKMGIEGVVSSRRK